MTEDDIGLYVRATNDAIDQLCIVVLIFMGILFLLWLLMGRPFP